MATVEYAALVVLVSLATAAGGTALGAERLPVAVAGQLRRALCLMQSGDCLGRDGPRPCVVREDERGEERRLQLVVLRLSDGRTVLREQRSEGTVALTVTLADDAAGGPTVRQDVQVAGRRAGLQLEALASAGLRSSRRFVVPDAAAADRLVRRLDAEALPVGGAVAGGVRFLLDRDDEADERTLAVRGQVEATAALRAVGLGGRLGGAAGGLEGLRIARRTGERTAILRVDRRLAAALTAPLDAGASGGRDDAVTLELTFDRHGSPAALAVLTRRSVAGAVRAGRLGGAEGGRRVDLEARLDLADPAVRTLAGAFVDRLRSVDPAALGVARALGERLASSARIDRRVFAVSSSSRSRGGHLAGTGISVVSVTGSARLVAADGYEPGLGWSRRFDCLPASGS